MVTLLLAVLLSCRSSALFEQLPAIGCSRTRFGGEHSKVESVEKQTGSQHRPKNPALVV
ncbi:MAG TPA: hypothetical protein VFR96_02775 [Povalibacter sp.]|nr:hypothetical protein [Povalibacter sp.]